MHDVVIWSAWSESNALQPDINWPHYHCATRGKIIWLWGSESNRPHSRLTAERSHLACSPTIFDRGAWDLTVVTDLIAHVTANLVTTVGFEPTSSRLGGGRDLRYATW